MSGVATILGAAIILVCIGVTIWLGRTDETGGNGDNVTAARRHGG